VRYKSRLVVLGCGQRYEVDYNETFAPVAEVDSIRILFALCCAFILHIHQMDVDTAAFLYAPLEEDINMVPPTGMFGIPRNHCLKLKKSLYGLKQAPANFNHLIDEFIIGLGFVKCVLDNCMYLMSFSNVSKVVIALYVDDILILSDNIDIIRDLKHEFKRNFQMKDLGEVKNYLGMRMSRTHDTFRVDQIKYARDVVQKFSRWMSKDPLQYKKSVPFYRDLKLSKTEEMTHGQVKYRNTFPFQEVTGLLLYLAINTRSDIAYAVNVLCRFNAKPTYSACRAAVRLLHYVKATLDYGIQYSGHRINPEGYADSDWGGDFDTGRSTTGYVLRLVNGPISWVSRLQSTVASSVGEVEYMSRYDLVQAVTWIEGVCQELRIYLLKNGPIQCFMDNKSAIALANNAVFHKRTKHIRIKYHWLDQKVAEGLVTLIYVQSEQNIADIFTKG
jgi:hypothetical protein